MNIFNQYDNNNMLVAQFQAYCRQLQLTEPRQISGNVQIPQKIQDYTFKPSSYESNQSSTSSPESNDYSNNTYQRRLPIRSEAIDKSILAQELKCIKGNRPIYCSFCKNNGENEDIYKSHSLKDTYGKITCPILKLHECPICHESGDKAHTLTYCKKYKQLQRIEKINAVIKRF